MDRTIGLDELVESWTLLEEEQDLVAGKRGATRLGFALLLKFYIQHGQFPRGRAAVPDDAVRFVAQQVKVPAAELGSYEWAGRTSRHHQAQIRDHLGFRECSVEDADKLTSWLVVEVCEVERQHDRVCERLLVRCRSERIEPPSSGRVGRIVRSALHQAEVAMTRRVAARLPVAVSVRLEALAAGPEPSGEADDSVLALVKSDPGNVSLESMLTEVRKLRAVRAIGLPADLFADVAPKVLAGWRARAAVEAPSHLRAHAPELRVTLLAALLHAREQEITDILVDLLISTVHRINARADRRVTQELVNAFKKVTGKENILVQIAEAALDAPDDPVRSVVFPAVNGGEQTLRELVHEYKTKGPLYRRTVQTTLRASYTNHYRRGLLELLDVLEFRSSNTAHRPVLDAVDLVARHKGGRVRFYPPGEHVPTHKGVLGDWAPWSPAPTRRAAPGCCARPMRCARSKRCVSSCAARRYGSSERTGGAVPMRIFHATSTNAVSSTTPLCASRWTRPPVQPGPWPGLSRCPHPAPGSTPGPPAPWPGHAPPAADARAPARR